MTKQEEIREGIAERLAVMDNLIYKRLSGEAKERNSYNTEVILNYLHSQGVVVQSKDEAIFHHGYFPKVEPLIKEE